MSKRPFAARPRVLVETLEPRILYSADLAAVAGLAGAEAGLVRELRLQDTAAPVATLAAGTATTAEIAFVDLGVPDAGTLVGGLLAQRAQGRPIDVVTFTGDDDGLALISRTLAERQADGTRFDAVHLLSHGRAGAVQLGAATLDADTLLVRAGEIAGWSGALGAQADLMLYGCDVAAGAGGLFLVEGLAALTGADVAASDDPTGGAALGGDWLLERHAGRIETAVAVDAATRQDWGGTLSGEVRVNSTTAGKQTTTAETRGSQQAVAMDAAGNYAVVWIAEDHNGQDTGVFVRRFAFDGTALTGEIQVNTTTDKLQHGARIVGDAAGGFAVAWTCEDQASTGSNVYFRRFAADGTALTGEIRANSVVAGDQHNAVIGLNAGNGDVVVAWQGDDTGADVFFRRFAADGTALDAADRPVATTGTPGGEHDPAVAMNGSGQFVVAWSANGHVHCQRFDSAGVAVGGQIQMDTDTGTASAAAVAIDAAGDFIATYRKDLTGMLASFSGLWSYTTLAGASAMTERQFLAGGDATSGAIGLGSDGSAVVVYQMTGDGDKLGVYARRLGANGAVQGAAGSLVNETTADDQLSASVAVHDASRFVVAWSGAGTGDTTGVFARSVAPVNAAPLITTNGGGGTAAVSVAENTTAVTTVGAGDADLPAQTVSYTIVGGADQSTFAIDSQTGALRFVVAPNFEHPTDVGLDNVYDVVVQASDGLLGSTQTLAVTVTDVDDQVHAVSDTASTPYVTPVTVDVLANDQRGLGTALTLLDVSQPARGSAEVVGDQVVYTPAAGFVGTDTLRYRVVDGSEGLVAFWALDEATGSLPTDPGSVQGVMNRAMAFDGVDDAMGLAGVSYGSEFTLAFWFKLASNSGTGYQFLYAHGAAGAQNSLNVYFVEDGTVGAVRSNQLRTALVDGNDTASAGDLALLDVDVTAAGLADDRWHLYTLTTQSGVGSSVYLDGVFRVGSGRGGDTLAPTGTTAVIGGNATLGADRFYTGALDDVQRYQGNLSATEVAGLLDGPGDIGTLTVTVTPVNDHAPVITANGGGATAVLSLPENTAAVATLSASDADVGGPALVYAIVGGADQALFAIDSASGAITFVGAPDAERPTDAGGDNVYDLEVQASDGVHADTQALAVVITDVQEHAITPVTDADPASDAVDENAAIGTTVGLTARATDADLGNNTVVYALEDAAGGRFAIDRDTGVVTVAATGLLDAETATLHRIDVRATSSDGSTQRQTFVLAVRDVDEFDVSPPVDADGGGNTVREDAAVGTRVGITALASDGDLGTSAVTYTLADDAGGRFAIDATRGVVTLAGGLDAETALGHDLVVQARSADGSVASQRFTVVVQDVNETGVGSIADLDPAADTVREDAAVGTVVGFQAHAVDADVQDNGVAYTLEVNPGGRFAIDPVSGVVRVAAALDAEAVSGELLLVRAVSQDGSSSTRWVAVAVQDADEFDVTAPVDGDAAANAVDDNAGVGTAVGITAWAEDADTSLDRVTYALADAAGGRFAIDADTGVVTLARSVATDGNSTQTLVVRATSADGSVATQAMAVAVRRTNLHAPVIQSDGGGATAALVVPEQTTGVLTTVVATDADVSGLPSGYRIVGGADAARFTLDAATGALRFVVAPDAEAPLDVGADNRYEVSVQASDGTFSDTQTLEVTVRDVDEFALAVVADADAAADQVQEGAAVGTVVGVQALAVDGDATGSTVTYTLDDAAGGRFAIDARTGVVTVAGLLDAETAQHHAIVVRATSDDRSTATLALTIAVRDVDEHAVGALSDTDARADSVREDDPVGTVVGLTALAQDLDATTSTISYALDDAAGGRFAIDASTGVVTIALALDAETAQQHDIVVRALSADGSAQVGRFTIAVRDVDEFDVGPVADGDATAETVAEDAAVGTRVGIAAQALDADASASTVRYTLDDAAGGRFAIDADTGVVTVAGPLDAEAALSHTVVVRATSLDGSVRTQAYTVAVADVDEFDLAALGDADGAADAVTEDAAVGTLVGLRAQSVDADATTHAVRYALTDDAGGRFAIDADTGVVTVAGPLDAEAAQAHTLVVQAQSADGSRWTQAFQVRVADVDEFDLVAIGDADGADNAVAQDAAVGSTVGLQGLAVDADVTPLGVTYTLDDAADGRFAVDAATGTVTLARAVAEEGVAAHTVVLRATSGDGSTVAAAFAIAVRPVNGHAPVIDSDGGGAAAALGVDEGQTAVTQVRARDADLPAETLRYAIAGGADAAAFTLDAATGQLRFAVAPDAEAPHDHGADNVYEVTVQASDGLHTDAQALRIAVQPVNDTAPVITSDGGGATARRHVDENTLLVTQAQAQDADQPAGPLAWTVAGGADAGLFTVDAATGVLRWRAAPDRETPRDAGADGVYDVTLSVSDGLHTTSQAIAVVVDNLDEAPQLDTSTLRIDEGGTAGPVLVARDVDTPAAALVYTVQDLTGGRFEQVAAPGVAITRFTQAEAADGAVRFVADGGEAAPAYRLVLSDGTTALAPQAAQVVFTPVNDAPVVAAVRLAPADEDGARLITAEELLATAGDEDGDALSVVGLRLTGGEGTLTDLGGGRWRVDPAADWHGTVTLAGAVHDGQAAAALAVSLPVQAVNDAPRIVSGGGAAVLALDVAENTTAVTTVVGEDLDAATPLRYAVAGGADAALFQIDAATGVLSFRQAPDREQAADADGDGRYDVVVEVGDGELTAQQALQVTVGNVDEAPVVTRNVLLLTDGAVTLVLQARDQDTPATALTYRVEAVEGGRFERAAVPGTAAQTFTQAELDAAEVVWVAQPDSTTARYALRLSDGQSAVRVDSPTVERQMPAVAPVALVADTWVTEATTAGEGTAAVPGPATAAARRADAAMPAQVPLAGDAVLGLGHGHGPERVDSGPRAGAAVPAPDIAVVVPRSLSDRIGLAPIAERVGPALDLPSEAAAVTHRTLHAFDLWNAPAGTALVEQLDRLRQEVVDAQRPGVVPLVSTVLVSTGLSVGYVIWLVRGGVLMTSLMSAVPAWAGMDPLPVLAEVGRGGADDGLDDDPIEKLFSKARRLLVRPEADVPGAPT